MMPIMRRLAPVVPMMRMGDYAQPANATNLQNYTFASSDIGPVTAPETHSRIAHAYGCCIMSAKTLSSLTIDGEAATIHKQQAAGTALTWIGSAVIPVSKASDKLVTILVNHSGTVNNCFFRCGRGIGKRQATAFDAKSATATATSCSLTLIIPGGGYGFCVAALESGTITSWDSPVQANGINNGFETLSNAFGEYRNQLLVPVSITFTINVSSSKTIAMSAASFEGDEHRFNPRAQQT